MDLKTVKSLLLFTLFCSAIFALTVISADLYAACTIADNCTNYMYNENTATLIYLSGTIDGDYTPCGDPVPGGGVPL